MTDLNSRVQLDTFTSGNICQFEPIDASLGEFQSSWDDQAIAGKGTIANDVVRNLHRLRLIEQNLSRGGRYPCPVPRYWDCLRCQNTRTRSAYHRAGFGQTCSRRHIVSNCGFSPEAWCSQTQRGYHA